MPTREEMHNLGQMIIAAREMEIQCVTDIKTMAHTQMKENQDAHKAMSGKLRHDLAKGEQERMRTFKHMQKEMTKTTAHRKTAVAAELHKFDTDHQSMAAKLRDDLATHEQERMSMSRHMHEERTKANAERKAVVEAEMRMFDEQMKEIAAIRAGGYAAWHELLPVMQSTRR